MVHNNIMSYIISEELRNQLK